MKTTTKLLTILTMALVLVGTTINSNAIALNDSDNQSEFNRKTDSNLELGFEYQVSESNPVGMSITNVYDNGLAQLMGIKKGDRIIGVGNKPVVMGNLNDLLKEQKPGEVVEFRVERRNEQIGVKAVMPSLFTTSNAGAFLGIETTKNDAETHIGVDVRNVLNNSAAQFAEIRKGDVILGVGNSPVVGDNLADLLNNESAGDVILIRIKRGNEQITKEVILGSHSNNIKNDSEVKNRIYTRL